MSQFLSAVVLSVFCASFAFGKLVIAWLLRFLNVCYRHQVLIKLKSYYHKRKLMNILDPQSLI